ncbi:MAG: hypothetical protein FWG05_00925 [Kiritimatiellaeota bacterium]|nr:hypothetical protein [Kiritimatiellota bacterium]
MKPLIPCCLLLFLAATAVQARVKLITMPPRERVEIQLENENATLVEEERIVPLTATPAGTEPNQVDFSWANTRIDPDSIVFRVLGPADPVKNAGMETRVLSVSYPPGEDALVWQVAASQSGSARVRISYILGNLSKSFNYRIVAANDEQSLTLAQYIRLRNSANEEFLSNLAPGEGANLWAGWGREFSRPVGLNETKEMLALKAEKVPVRKTYTADASAIGYIDRPKNKLRIEARYVVENTAAANLGASPLPAGKARIFIEPSNPDAPGASTAFLGEDWGKFTPIGDELELNLGTAQDIAVVRTIDKTENIRVAGNLFDRVVIVKYEIENFKDTPATLDIRENIDRLRAEVFGAPQAKLGAVPSVEWEILPDSDLNDPDPKKAAFDSALFHIDLPARDKDGKAEKVVKRLALKLKNEW